MRAFLSLLAVLMFSACSSGPEMVVESSGPDGFSRVKVVGGDQSKRFPAVELPGGVSVGEGHFFQAPTYDSNILMWAGVAFVGAGAGMFALKAWMPLFPSSLGMWTAAGGLALIFSAYAFEKFSGIVLACVVVGIGAGLWYTFRPCPVANPIWRKQDEPA